MIGRLERPPVPSGRTERRGSPRSPADIPVTISSAWLRAAGRLLDASADGLLVRLEGPCGLRGTDVEVRLGVPAGGALQARASIARRDVAADGRPLLGLRLDPPAHRRRALPAPVVGARRSIRGRTSPGSPRPARRSAG